MIGRGISCEIVLRWMPQDFTGIGNDTNIEVINDLGNSPQRGRSPRGVVSFPGRYNEEPVFIETKLMVNKHILSR